MSMVAVHFLLGYIYIYVYKGDHSPTVEEPSEEQEGKGQCGGSASAEGLWATAAHY